MEYSFDGPQLLGTAGALRQALPLLGDAFFVIYGDSYLPCDYRRPWQRFRRVGQARPDDGLPQRGPVGHSNVEFAGGRILAYDKANRTPAMRHIDYGLGVFQRDALRRCAGAASPTTWPRFTRTCCAAENWPRGSRPKRFYEIGSVEGIARSRGVSQVMTFTRTVSGRSRCRSSKQLDAAAMERVAATLAARRAAGGRLFILGVGGSAANASHAVNDFRKICGLEAYAPTDNVTELTARTNDEGWAGSSKAGCASAGCARRMRPAGLLGGRRQSGEERQPEPGGGAPVCARRRARKSPGSWGATAATRRRMADACVIVPTVNADHVTPHAEAFQAVVWHLLVSHPALKQAETKWESVQ